MSGNSLRYFVRRATKLTPQWSCTFIRPLSTLEKSPHVYVFKNPSQPSSYTLSLLRTSPPTEALALGTTTSVPPTPHSFTENPRFLNVLHSVIAEHAHEDPQVQGQAAAMASTSGAMLFQPNSRTVTGSAGASAQGGAGSAGRGGWIHVSDNRHPPDFGRIADPEDIFGSLEVDGSGQFVDGTGRYQISGTYRIVTIDGVMHLPDYLAQKLHERLQVEESAVKNQS